jgi:glucokinase
MAAPWLLGIEIGGTKLQLAIGRGNGHVHAMERLGVDPGGGAQAILRQIEASFGRLLDHASMTAAEIRGAGVGFGGPVDAACGRVHHSFQIQGWTDFPLADWLRNRLKIPIVRVQNDADTAGLAEALLGAGVGLSPLLYVTIGSGIGGALVVDGEIYRGAGLGAAEIGHLGVVDRGDATARIVELEQIASGWGIARQAREAAEKLLASGDDWMVLSRAHGRSEAITTELVAQAAIEGDERAEAVLDRARRAMAFALCQAIALLAPRRIILGGGVSLIGQDHWFEPIRRLVEAEVFRPFQGSFDIVPAKLGEEVVVHGALLLAGMALGESVSQGK